MNEVNMADTRKYTGYEEEFELSNNQKIKIDNTVNSIINDITTEILEKKTALANRMTLTTSFTGESITISKVNWQIS